MLTLQDWYKFRAKERKKKREYFTRIWWGRGAPGVLTPPTLELFPVDPKGLQPLAFTKFTCSSNKHGLNTTVCGVGWPQLQSRTQKTTVVNGPCPGMQGLLWSCAKALRWRQFCGGGEQGTQDLRCCYPERPWALLRCQGEIDGVGPLNLGSGLYSEQLAVDLGRP